MFFNLRATRWAWTRARAGACGIPTAPSPRAATTPFRAKRSRACGTLARQRKLRFKSCSSPPKLQRNVASRMRVAIDSPNFARNCGRFAPPQRNQSAKPPAVPSVATADAPTHKQPHGGLVWPSAFSIASKRRAESHAKIRWGSRRGARIFAESLQWGSSRGHLSGGCGQVAKSAGCLPNDLASWSVPQVCGGPSLPRDYHQRGQISRLPASRPGLENLHKSDNIFGCLGFMKNLASRGTSEVFFWKTSEALPSWALPSVWLSGCLGPRAQAGESGGP